MTWEPDGPGAWLRLAAAPAFGLMAIATGFFPGAQPDPLCAADHGWALGGMAPMYALMSVVHAPPWLKLILGR